MSRTAMAVAALAWPLLAAVPGPGGPPALQTAPVNPAFAAWAARPAPTGGPARAGGPRVGAYLPHPVDLSHIKGPVFTPGVGEPPLPAYFDLRAEGLTTPVKDQGPYGTCWAFACTGSLEASMLIRGNGALSLSEWHLAYYAYQPFNTSLLTAFTSLWVPPGVDPVFDQGGNDLMSTALLARGTGAVAEKDCPYHTGAYRDAPRPKGDLPNGREDTRVVLADALYLFGQESPASAGDLKYALTHYGPACVALEWLDGDYDLAQATYRDTTTTVNHLNHEVCIVGWDDTFETCRFPASNRPKSPGAWIARNSWSRAWGLGGYFYISYDSKLFDGTVFVGSGRRSRRIHQYDPLGWCSARGYGSPTAYCANLFLAPEDEKVTAVSFYAAAVGTSYSLQLLSGLIGGGPEDLTSGKSLMSQPQQGTIATPGYHVVQLAAPVAVPKGKFAVVLKLTTPGYNYPIPVQDLERGYSDQATYEWGRGLISPDGQSWQDLAPGCVGAAVCLKAFADRD